MSQLRAILSEHMDGWNEMEPHQQDAEIDALSKDPAYLGRILHASVDGYGEMEEDDRDKEQEALFRQDLHERQKRNIQEQAAALNEASPASTGEEMSNLATPMTASGMGALALGSAAVDRAKELPAEVERAIGFGARVVGKDREGKAIEQDAAENIAQSRAENPSYNPGGISDLAPGNVAGTVGTSIAGILPDVAAWEAGGAAGQAVKIPEAIGMAGVMTAQKAPELSEAIEGAGKGFQPGKAITGAAISAAIWTYAVPAAVARMVGAGVTKEAADAMIDKWLTTGQVGRVLALAGDTGKAIWKEAATMGVAGGAANLTEQGTMIAAGAQPGVSVDQLGQAVKSGAVMGAGMGAAGIVGDPRIGINPPVMTPEELKTAREVIARNEPKLPEAGAATPETPGTAPALPPFPPEPPRPDPNGPAPWTIPPAEVKAPEEAPSGKPEAPGTPKYGEILEQSPIIKFISDNGGIVSKGSAGERNAGDYGDALATTKLADLNKLVFGGDSHRADQMAQMLHDAGLIPDAHPTTMWEHLNREVETLRRLKDDAGKVAGKAEADQRKEQADAEWAKNAETVPAGALQVGDTFSVQGEKFRVVDESDQGIKIKDGVEHWIPYEQKKGQFSSVQVDKGSLKAAEAVPGENPDSDIQPMMDTVSSAGGVDAFKPGIGIDRRDQTAVPENPNITEPVSRLDILNGLRKGLNLPIRQPLMSNIAKRVLAFFRPRTFEVRGRNLMDTEVVAHETGHALQQLMGIKDSTLGQFALELQPIASPTIASKQAGLSVKEGFAEFVRYYITNDAEAHQVAPNFYKWFESELKKNPEINATIIEARDKWEKYLSQPYLKRILGNFSMNPAQKAATDWYTHLVDNLEPLRRVVEAITKGKELQPGEDPTSLAYLSRGSAGQAETAIAKGMVDWKTLEVIPGIKSLSEILKPIHESGELDLFRAYLVSLRTLEYNKAGRASGIRVDDAARAVGELGPKFSGARDALDKWQDGLLRVLVDSGVVSESGYNQMKAANKFYVPFYRDVSTRTGDEQLHSNTGSGTGGSDVLEQRSDGIHSVTREGSELPIVDPLESIVKNAFMFFDLANKNSVGQALVKLSEKFPGNGRFLSPVSNPTKAFEFTLSQIERQLPKELQWELTAIGKSNPAVYDTMMRVFQAGRPPENGFMSVFIDGKPRLFQVSPDVERAMKGLDRASMGVIEKILSYPVSWLRTGSTLDPSFIIRNMIRDAFSAQLYSKYGFVMGYDTLRGLMYTLAASNKAWVKAIPNMMGFADKMFWDWKASGGSISEFMTHDREATQETMKQLIGSKPESSGWMIIDTPMKVVQLGKWMLHQLRQASEVSEQATRVGEFARGIDKLGTDKAAKQAAGLSSRQVSIDFSRAGTTGRVWNSMLAFSNVKFQGLDLLAKAFKRDPQGATLTALKTITLPTLALALYQANDPRYQDIDQWQRDLFWPIIMGRIYTRSEWEAIPPDQRATIAQQTIIRIPKPDGLLQAFATIPERMVMWLKAKDPQAFNGIAETILSDSSPIGLPNMFGPVVGNFTNYSTFMQRPIVSVSERRNLPQYQYGPNDPEILKATSRLLGNVPMPGGMANAIVPAPMQQNLIQGHFGGLGRLAVHGADLIGRKAGMLPDNGPAPTAADTPGVQGLVVRYPKIGGEEVTRFHNGYSEFKQRMATVQFLAKQQNLPDIATVMEKPLANLSGIEKGLHDLAETAKIKMSDPRLSAAEKLHAIAVAGVESSQLAKTGNDIMNNLTAAWGKPK